ncbi:MAG: hypothetical protein LBR55_01080, partial [Bacteroidales bacterium]|nr:hypothetical protein [Bacteroidales bacterium]
IAIGAVVYAVVYFVPETANVWLNIAIKSCLAGILYCAGIYVSRVSPDVQELVEVCKRKLGLQHK